MFNKKSLFSLLGSILSIFVFGKNANAEPVISQLEQPQESLNSIEDNNPTELVEIDTLKNGFDFESFENFIDVMKLKYEVQSFDGSKLRLKVPQKDKLILAAQDWAK